MNLKEIAKLCNVSPSTISRVINENGYVKEEKKQLILSILENNGYKKNIVFKQKFYFKIGIITPNLENKFYNEIIENFVKNSSKDNFLFSFFFNNYILKKEIDSLEECNNNKMDAIIYIPFAKISDNKKITTIINKINVPILILDNSFNSNTIHSISLDNKKGGYLLTESLVANNHKNILFLNGDKFSEVAVSREEGGIEYLNSQNLKNIKIDTIYSSFHNFNVVYSKLKKIDFQKEKYSAIIAGNNIIAAGCIKFLREKNIEIGKDISLVSFDDSDLFDIFNLKISVIAADLQFIGELSHKIISKELKSPSDNRQQLKILPKLKLKGSEKFPTAKQ